VDAVKRYVESRPMPPAVVADVGWVNGLSAIRQLERAGAPVIAIDHHPGALGFRSRYGLGVHCPDPVQEADAFHDFLGELGDALGRPAPIFPTHDDYVKGIATAAPDLGDRFLYPFPPWDVLEPIQEKRFQVEQAEKLGIPTPKTTLEPTDELRYPVLVKPSDPIGFRREFQLQSFQCATRAELDEAFARAQPFGPLIQELIPGGDDELYSLGAYMTKDGEFLGTFSGRKLRQTPPTVGSGRVCEAVWVDEVVEQGRAFLRGLGCYGLSHTEFKRDPRDGVYKLMEVNPRIWQWHGLAAACGVDFPRIAYWDLLGARMPPVESNGARKRWAVTFMSGTKPAVPRLPYVEAVFSVRDPKPALAQVARIVRRRLR
jgi:D-aspartate ligase